MRGLRRIPRRGDDLTRSGERAHTSPWHSFRVDIVADVSIEGADIAVEHRPDGVALVGDIDAHTAPQVRDALLPAVIVDDVRADFSGVTFIDSSGLRVVLDVHQMLQRDGRRLVLVHPSTPVARVVRLAGLTDILHVEPPLDPGR